MRKWIALLLAGSILLTLGGCKKKKPKQESSAAVFSSAAENTPESTEHFESSEFVEFTEQKPEAPVTSARTLAEETTTSDSAKTTAAASYETGPLTDSGYDAETEGVIDRDGVYTSKEDVALYLYTYHELPSNFITKKEAQKLGWEGGSLEPYAPGCCIGGSYFGNYEGSLPEKNGREYHECDIDTLGKKSRGAKRIVYSNDGLIYYTGDHYKTFELLYGEE